MIVNNKYNGFTLIEQREVPDIHSNTYYFIHDKTKARLFYIENDDDNKTFSITFKTPPKDETGLTHILEHSVLSGSEKYPVKSPFLELRKSSLSTFLNAMTFSDKTMYPVSSKNDKDFENLMDTYLDAVFNPLVRQRKEIFLQEGWRYEVDKETGDLSFNGIVFNEMKGAYSSPDRVLINAIKSSLYPDNAYGMDSGGNPEKIVDLEYKEFLEYHEKYYHPSNSYILLYGEMDILEKLAYLDEQYLSRYQHEKTENFIPWQEGFSAPKKIASSYGIGKSQSVNGKAFLTRNYVVDRITEKTKVLGFMILEKIFFDATGSELKKRLLAAGIAEEIDGFYYTVGKQPFFTFLARNSEQEYYDVFNRIIDEYLKELFSNGIPEEELLGAINSIEFRLRENTSSASRGINYAQTVMNSWLYGDNPVLFLEFEDTLHELRQKMQEGYFEALIKEYFIDNKHASEVLLLPEQGLEERINSELNEKLADYRQEITEERYSEIIFEQENLERYQKEGDSEEALASIPSLAIDDIDRKQEEIPLEVNSQNDSTYLLHPMFSNKIVYLDLYFDTNAIPQEKIKYIYLLSDLLTSLSTKEYDYQKLANKINISTGGIDFSVLCINRFISEDIRPMLRVSSKSFIENLDEMMKLVIEVVTNTIYSDKKRLKEEITELKSIKESEFLDDSMSIAQNRLLSYFMQSGRYQEEGNINYYYFLKELNERFEEKFEETVAELESAARNIFCKEQLTCSITNDSEDIHKVKKTVETYFETLPPKAGQKYQYDFSLENLREGIAIPAKVQYVVKGGNFKAKGEKYSGYLRVLAKILNTDYLWQQLRVLGGAYGGFASISIFGNVVFSSYRDPKLSETLEVYNGVSDYFRNLEIDREKLVKFIIGTIGDYDNPMNVSTKGKISNLYFFQEIDQSDLQRIREEILDTSLEQLKNFADTLDKINQDNYYCIIGNEKKLEENREIFKKIMEIY